MTDFFIVSLFMSTTCTGGEDIHNRATGRRPDVIMLGQGGTLFEKNMRLDAEKTATALMTVAIAGVGPVCVALLLLL